MSERSFNLLLENKDLTSKQSRDLFLDLFKQKISEARAKAILLLLAKKGETSEELLGCIQALEILEPKKRIALDHVLDTCGTGGDKSHSINVSTLSAFVIAGAGGYVAKHGNRSITSKCGSSDLLEALGVKIDASAARMIEALRKCGMGYFHAPSHHPVFARVAPLRKKLGVRTIFNMLGPMVNPIKLKRQIVGTASVEIAKTYAHVLKKRKMTKAWICSGREGFDEISTSGTTDVFVVTKGRVQKKALSPKSMGIKKSRQALLKGGSVTKNKSLALKLLQGKIKGAMRDVILINAAAGIVVAGIAKSHQVGMKLALESLESGNALRVLEKLKKISNKKTTSLRGAQRRSNL